MNDQEQKIFSMPFGSIRAEKNRFMLLFKIKQTEGRIKMLIYMISLSSLQNDI